MALAVLVKVTLEMAFWGGRKVFISRETSVLGKMVQHFLAGQRTQACIKAIIMLVTRVEAWNIKLEKREQQKP